MATLASIEKALLKLSKESELEKLIIEAAKPLAAEIIDFNISNLNRGEMPSGINTKEYASISYTNYKSSIGSKSLPYMDFKDRGDFQSKFKIEFGKYSGDIYSTDEKADDIEERFDKITIYGLQDKDKIETGHLVAPGFIKLFRNAFR